MIDCAHSSRVTLTRRITGKRLASASTAYVNALPSIGSSPTPSLAGRARHLSQMAPEGGPPAPEQGEAQWPGEGSFRRRAEYLKHGIALPPPLAAELEALAREMSLTIALAG